MKTISLFIFSFFPFLIAYTQKMERSDLAIAKGQMPSITKDKSNKIHIVYGSGDSIMYISSRDGNSFASPSLVAVLPKLFASAMRGPQIAATVNGLIVSACTKDGNIFSYKKQTSGKWTKAVRVNDAKETAKEALMGLSASWHAKFQKFTARVIEPSHPSMQGLPAVWEKEDEFYFAKELYPGTKTILVNDISSLNTTDTIQKNLILKHAGTFAELYPATWTNDFDGGHTWFTTLGHHKKDYADPVYIQHILGGIRFVASQVKKLDFSKAYADSRDTPVRY